MIRVGHPFVVAMLVILGLWMLVSSTLQIPELLKGLRQFPHAAGSGEQVGYFVDIRFVGWIPVLICAWGILRWRRWGQALTIALCSFVLLMQVAGIVNFGRAYAGGRWILVGLAASAILSWLVLPHVRSQFRI